MNASHDKQYNQEIRNWLFKVFDHAAGLARGPLKLRKCPICASEERSFYANNGYLDYQQCDDCSLIYQNPAPSADDVDRGFTGDDPLLTEYFAITRKYGPPSPPAKPDPSADAKLKDIYVLRQKGRLLDVGCSIGTFLEKASHFYDAEGVEVNPLTAAVAQERFKVHRGYLSELNLPRQYDIVTLHQILYGIPDPAGLLRDIHKILQEDGLLYINTPNADSYAMAFYKGRSSHLYGYTTLNLFNERSLARLAGETGFRIVSFRTEWLDIYLTDVQEFLDHPELFIHKKNSHIPGYETKIAQEDALHRSLGIDLGKRGNYLVAVLEKI